MMEDDELPAKLRALATRLAGEDAALIIEAADELESMQSQVEALWHEQQYPRD